MADSRTNAAIWQDGNSIEQYIGGVPVDRNIHFSVLPGLDDSNTAIGTTFRFAIIGPMKRSGDIRTVGIYIAATVTDNIELSTWDCGWTTSGVYTKKYASGSFGSLNANAWNTKDPGAGVHSVLAGQYVMVGYQAAAANTTHQRALGGSNSMQIPTLVTALNFGPGITTMIFHGTVAGLTLGSLPATIANASPVTNATRGMLMLEVT